MNKFTNEDLIKTKKALVEIIRYNTEEIYDNGVEIGYENPLQDECYSISKALEELERLLPKPKKVGDLMCKEQECRTCPIRFICRENRHINNTLYFNLELYKKDQSIHYDQRIYDLLKARLDKEVE